MNVVALFVPPVNVACARWNLVPLGILVCKIAIEFAKRRWRKSGLHGVPDFAQSRPQIAQESFFAVLVPGERVAGEIDVNPASQGKGHNQRR